MNNPFEIKKHKVTIPLLVHIPHSSTYIPLKIKGRFLLNNKDLQKELLKMTDRYTDNIIFFFFLIPTFVMKLKIAI